MQIMIISICIWGLAMIRLNQSDAFMHHLLDLVSDLSLQDLKQKRHEGKDCLWRFNVLEAGPTLGQLVLKFWKPLKAEEWWEDTSFLRD